MFSIPLTFSLPRPRVLDLFGALVFLYFVTLHADQLNCTMGGYTVRFNNMIALILLTILVMRPYGKVIAIHRQLVLGLGGITASLLISFGCSPYKTRCFVFIGWWAITVCCYVLVPYLLFRIVEIRRILKLYFASFFVVGAIAAFQGFISLFSSVSFFAHQHAYGQIVRPNAFAYEPSFYALYMSPFVVMIHLHYFIQRQSAAFLFKQVNKKHLLIIHFLFLISTATSTIFTYAIFATTLLILTWATKWKHNIAPLGKAVFKWICALLGLLMALMAASPIFAKNFFLKFFIFKFHQHHSFMERWTGIVNAWKVFLEHPWVGIGLGGLPSHFYNAYMRGDRTYLFTFRENYFSEWGRSLKLFEPTNVFTEVLSSLGICGIVAFAFLIFSYVRLTNQAHKRLAGNPYLRNWVFIFLVSVLVDLFVLQFNQGLMRCYIWTHFAIAYAFTERAMENAEKTSRLFPQDPLQEGL